MVGLFVLEKSGKHAIHAVHQTATLRTGFQVFLGIGVLQNHWFPCLK